MPSHLLRRPAQGTRLHHITPQNAGWTYVGFEVHQIAPGGSLQADTGKQELCIVMLSGKAAISAGGTALGTIGERHTPFAGPPWSAYIPAASDYALTAATACEIALCFAPGKGGIHPARVIAPRDVSQLMRGTGSNTRHVANILPEDAPAESLLVVEVITPAGCWSSYPPHKHDRDALPAESLLEETYYHRLNPSQGFGMQRVYTDDRSLDETMSFADRDVVLVPRGYHPCAAPHGYDLYYLNVMAGPKRVWKFHNDPAHEWMLS